MTWHFTVTANDSEDVLRAFKAKALDPAEHIPAPYALCEAAQNLLWRALKEGEMVTLTSSGHFDENGRGSVSLTVGTVLASPLVDA